MARKKTLKNQKEEVAVESKPQEDADSYNVTGIVIGFVILLIIVIAALIIRLITM